MAATNEGSEEHQPVLVRLDDGLSPDQYLASAVEDPAAASELLELPESGATIAANDFSFDVPSDFSGQGRRGWRR